MTARRAFVARGSSAAWLRVDETKLLTRREARSEQRGATHPPHDSHAETRSYGRLRTTQSVPGRSWQERARLYGVNNPDALRLEVPGKEIRNQKFFAGLALHESSRRTYSPKLRLDRRFWRRADINRRIASTKSVESDPRRCGIGRKYRSAAGG
jgi:hypothetical protein